jgi:hypothetical protein
MNRPKVKALTLEMLQIGTRYRYLCVNGYNAHEVYMTSFVAVSAPRKCEFFGGTTTVIDVNFGSDRLQEMHTSTLGLIPAKRYNLWRTFLWSQELEDYLKQKVVGKHLTEYEGWTEYLLFISGTLSEEEIVLIRPEVQAKKRFGSRKNVPFIVVFA